MERMKARLKRVNQTRGGEDVVIEIECRCGNKVMKEVDSGNFVGDEIFVYMQGVPIKWLRCAKPSNLCTRKPGEDFCNQTFKVIPDKESRTVVVSHMVRLYGEVSYDDATIPLPPREECKPLRVNVGKPYKVTKYAD